jgi:hypothetical protein
LSVNSDEVESKRIVANPDNGELDEKIKVFESTIDRFRRESGDESPR